ncbi:hypothetical protein BHM03_00019720 [Ensete ventricosum]|nr:hypothetical protein BHM03_00019720 [Ensete ventricosum]
MHVSKPDKSAGNFWVPPSHRSLRVGVHDLSRTHLDVHVAIAPSIPRLSVSSTRAPPLSFPSNSRSKKVEELPSPHLRGPLDPPPMASELIYRGVHDAHPWASGGDYVPKPEKRLLWLSRPLRYLLREQRLVFVLVGMALASLLFALAPSSSSSSAVAAKLDLRSVEPTRFGAFQQHHHRTAFEAAAKGFVGGKVPLGIKRKGLRVVVTGGAGFVGSHLVDRLIARGDSVIVVDNFFTGRKENVMHHFGNPNFELIRHDVVEPLLLEVDQIYHLACPASPVHYKFNPIKTIISLYSLSFLS